MKKIYAWYYYNCIYIHTLILFIGSVTEIIKNSNPVFKFLIYALQLMTLLILIFSRSSGKVFLRNNAFIVLENIDYIHQKTIKSKKYYIYNLITFLALISIVLIGFLEKSSISLYILLNIALHNEILSSNLNNLSEILYEEPLPQLKEEIIYEELRTRFASHNITKDVRNLKSYITILKHEEPQLLAKFTTLDELTDMVEDTLSKFKNSDTIRTKNPFLIHELFDNFLILNKPDLVREGSDLQIEYQKTEFKDIEIHQIFYEVYQVLNNLIDNARKAIANSERKEIQILTSVSKAGFVDFQVSDTGVGIDAKARNRVFDIGYSTTNGDGLGLLFVQTTLKRFGGEIQLLPTALSGFSTTFEVKIPT